MRILYVEDNPELRETIGMLMEGEGRRVTSCASAEEALALDAGDPFDVLVTDVSLPGNNALPVQMRRRSSVEMDLVGAGSFNANIEGTVGKVR